VLGGQGNRFAAPPNKFGGDLDRLRALLHSVAMTDTSLRGRSAPRFPTRRAPAVVRLLRFAAPAMHVLDEVVRRPIEFGREDRTQAIPLVSQSLVERVGSNHAMAPERPVRPRADR